MRHWSDKRMLYRWLIPVYVTLILIAAVRYRNSFPQSLESCRTPLFLVLGLWTLVCWWIALSRRRHERFLRRLLQPIAISIAVVAAGLLVIFDLLSSLTTVNALVLAAVALVIVWWLLAAGDPREAVHKLALLVGGSIVGIIILEVFFRFVMLNYHVPKTERDFQKWITSKWPHSINMAKPPGTLRIVGLGDSFGTEGGTENYHYLLETLLRDDGTSAEVVNFSHPAYQPSDELEIIRRFGGCYQPDLLLHSFYIGNDFLVPEGELVSYRGIGFRLVRGWQDYRPRRFALATWLHYCDLAWRDQKLRDAQNARDDHPGAMAQETFLRVERECFQSCCLEPPPEMRWAETIQLLDAIQAVAARMGARYVLVLQPFQSQVEPQLRQEVEQEYGLNSAEYDLDLPQKFLVRYCDARQVPCLDLLPAFRTIGSTEGLYLPRNTHYNREGNALAARTIYNFLREKHLLDPKDKAAVSP